ncbi:DNA polymerase III subunit gamma/tau [Microcoleus sp. FACHB-1515]|uniref:DNA polymerase III subunit gamma/tau n=1 Tax=Cyanophyceae TaxID=3028117 RepID=UPI001689DCFE|nr:DNA polymerase III subunit gamma/tau [Microcoleus sp. FACHB-1515]MBD2091907.1 DNA polymerase III subunit gamma/tau [Microcoleus sp. FACHB-1515]
MSYEPLHHKYRPQTFAQLVGQGAIATTLSTALRSQRIAPAYLFTGARGTGKTSSARIFAKSLNCLNSDVPTDNPCGVCEVCRSIANGSALDVIEIDAASNTGVDNIRELIERAQFAPVQCRFKVYVVDECHMLSTQAFNALLKTLEEPPDRVVFVLATTDPQRVLPTIISRCQRFDFRRIPLAEMVAHLQAIAQKEFINIQPDALQLVAQLSQGGLRDAESLLDQLSLMDDEVTIDRVWDLVGAVPERELLNLVKAIAASDGVTAIESARRLMDRGREPLIVLQNLASFFRDLLIAKTAGDRSDLVSLTAPTWSELRQFSNQVDLSWILTSQQQLRESEQQIKSSTQPRLWLEVALMTLLPAGDDRPISAPAFNREVVPPPVVRESIANNFSPPESTPEPIASPPTPVEELPADPQLPADAQPPTSDLDRLWKQVLELVQPFSTQAMLRQQCHLIDFTGKEARIGTKTEKLFNMAKAKLPNIEAAFTQRCGQPVSVTLEVVLPGAMTTLSAIESPQSAAIESVPSPPIDRAEAAPPPPVWEEDDVTKAAKNLAQMFNGQIVDLDQADGAIEEVAIPPEPELPEVTVEEDADDEEDIPFLRPAAKSMFADDLIDPEIHRPKVGFEYRKF